MTAIERVAQAARTAGLEVTESTSARWIILTAPDRHRITVKYDRAGRLIGGSRHIPGDITRTMTASGLEARVMSWLDEHRVDTVIPAAVDIMADLDRQYEAEDAFAQGGASGLAQLDDRRRMPPDASRHPERAMTIKAVNLFSGAGGWEQGATGIPGLRVYGIEIDPTAAETARLAGHEGECADVTKVDLRAFAGVDGVIGSPPCQTFSIGGKGSGRRDLDLVLRAIEATERGEHVLPSDFADPRTALVVEPLRWILALRPEWFALEQTPLALPVWEAMAVVLRRAGYSVVTGKLKTERYGVAQTRTRAVCIGSRVRTVSLPAPTHQEYKGTPVPGLLDYVTMAEAIGWGMTERPSYTVTGGGPATGGSEPIARGGRLAMAREREAGRWVQRSNYTKGTVTGTGTREFGERQLDEPSSTVTGRPPRWQSPTGAVMRMTVDECALLQSFPTEYPWQGKKNPQYLQVGNAVPPLLARAVLQALVCCPECGRPSGRPCASWCPIGGNLHEDD